jgi:folylpolyglutamate synthase/dihydropteroate synthase
LEIWDKKGIAIENPKDAIRFAQQHAAPEDAIFVGGSNYLVGEALEMYEV